MGNTMTTSRLSSYLSFKRRHLVLKPWKSCGMILGFTNNKSSFWSNVYSFYSIPHMMYILMAYVAFLGFCSFILPAVNLEIEISVFRITILHQVGHTSVFDHGRRTTHHHLGLSVVSRHMLLDHHFIDKAFGVRPTLWRVV